MPPKRRRSDNPTQNPTPPPPPPPAKTPRSEFDLGATLYEEVESGALLDVILTVGDAKLYAHKTVVSVVSPVFKAMLTEQLVDKEKDKRGILEFPPGTSVPAAKAFIKAIYLKEMDPDLDILLGVVSLCDMFEVGPILGQCIDSVLGLITPHNCVKIYEASLQLTKGKRLLDAAFECLSKNVKEVLEASWNSFGFNLWKKLLLLEGPDVNIQEDFLFEQLLNWRNADASRETEFRQLLPLIRFPIMTSEIVARVVQPSKVLSGDEVADLFCYIVGGGDKGNCIPKFVSHSRKWKIATNARELHTILENALPGDFIQLLAGEYVGHFEINVDKVTLKGAGPSTILIGKQPEFYACGIWANDVKISDMLIKSRPNFRPSLTKESLGLLINGSRCVINNINLYNCELTISQGNFNTMTNINCEAGIYGIRMKDRLGNSLSNITLSNLNFGIYVYPESSGNIIRNVKCSKVLDGVTIHSDDNVVEDVEYSFDKEKMNQEQDAIQIFGGSRNKVTRVQCQGYDLLNTSGVAPRDKFGLTIGPDDDDDDERDSIAKDNIISNLGPGPVKLSGEGNQLAEVDAADLLQVSGQGHKFQNCLAQKYIVNDATDLELADCNFK